LWSIRYRLAQIYHRQPARLWLMGGAALATVVLLGCAMLIVIGTALGAIVAHRGDGGQPAAAAPTETATPDLFHSPPETPIETATPPAAAHETPQPEPASPDGEVLSAAGSPSEALDLVLPVAAQPPVMVPTPDSLLELTPTSELTLASVILVENVGQFPPDVRFQVRGAAGGGLFLAPNALWMTLLPSGDLSPAAQVGPRPQALGDAGGGEGLSLRLSFSGANPNPKLQPLIPLDTQVSYFSGSDPARWHLSVPVWAGVRYVDLYPGIDLEIGSQAGRYAQRLVLRPGADASVVRLQIEGAQGLTLQAGCTAEPAPDGAVGALTLCISTRLGPVAWPLFQAVDEGGELLPASNLPAPRIGEGGSLVETPFASQAAAEGPGVLELTSNEQAAGMLYASLLGQGGNDTTGGIAVDLERNAYIAGRSFVPTSLAAPGPFRVSSAGSFDAFVLKMSGDGSEMVYAAFLGGRDYDSAAAIAVDRDGSATVAGTTRSPDLPGAAGHFRPSHLGGDDAFALKLRPSGTDIAYATYLGGTGDDRAAAVALDDSGSAYVAGTTASSDFALTDGAWDTRLDGTDAFLLKLEPAGAGLAYSTLVGGQAWEQGMGVAVDGAGRAVLVGTTASADLSTTEGAPRRELSGETDAFMARLNETGTNLLFGTYLGGSDVESAHSVAVDAAGNAYVSGTTRSADFPVTGGAFGTEHAGQQDAFMVKVDVAGTLAYAGLLGGSGDDWGQAISVDAGGNATLAGSSTAFPRGTAESGAGEQGGSAAFVVRVDEFGSALSHASSLGSGDEVYAAGVAVDTLGSVYVVGNAARGRDGSAMADAFMTKLVVGTPFLDLPVAYGNFAQAALGNVGGRGEGRVNSWFDHSYPTHSSNNNLTRWDGVTIAFDASSPPRIGESWYDGHGGIDFGWHVLNEPIYAAAPGLVIDTVTSCRVGDQACGSYFGNRVWIDHGNGYATVYAHMKTVSATVGTLIHTPGEQPLGIMGNTGRSLGTHLHFGLYFDANRDGRWSRNEVVDPYGWLHAGPDPWRGPSSYLWAYPIWTRQRVEPGATAEERTFGSPSGLVTVTVPSGALSSPAVFELWDVPPGADPVAEWRSTGYSFLLTGQQQGSNPALSEPLTVTLAGDLRNMPHVNVSKLALRRWDESRKSWTALPTAVNSTRTGVTAQTAEMGRFDLHAPLICPADIREPDDHHGAAQVILADGTPVVRLFDIRQDLDWFLFEAKTGGVYHLEVRGLAAGVQPVLGLYDADTVAPLAPAIEARGTLTATATWRAPLTGTYLLRASPAPGSTVGCAAVYQLRVAEMQAPESITLSGPATGKVAVPYTFKASVSPLAVTLPISYAWQVPGRPQSSAGRGLSDTVTISFSEPGTYRLVITASNSAGSVSTDHAVVIQPPLKAALSASPISGRAPLKVSFGNTSVGDYTESLWDFGDGQTSGARDPSHTYEAPGVYTVTLTVSGPDSKDTVTRAGLVQVEAGAPTLPSGAFRLYLPFVRR
jgi:murein DD-endopeptidase MepM/ murein hydrolase activator NlpD